jgi:hypothetical protein
MADADIARLTARVQELEARENIRITMFNKQQEHVQELERELQDVRRLHETLFMQPLLSRTYPPLDPPELRDDDGQDWLETAIANARAALTKLNGQA